MLLDRPFVTGFIISTPSKSVTLISVENSQFVIILVAMACLLIGSKIEEELRPMSKIIRVFYSIYQKRKGLPITELADTDPVWLGFLIYL